MASFLEKLTDTLRGAPMSAIQSLRYGEGQDPYISAIQNYQSLGYPAPGAEKDVGQAQRYNATNLATKRYGFLPLLTNALHEAVLSNFSQGENGPNFDRWMAGNRGVWDAMKQNASGALDRLMAPPPGITLGR
jgi:hypothetical protein